jgi:hypothetical protein
LGSIDLDRPLVKTSQETIEVSKEEWKGSILRDNIEADYIYATVLGRDLIPFGHIRLRPLVSPLIPQSKDYRLLRVDELRSRGSHKIAGWVETCQKYWEQIRTEKSARNYPLVIDRLNYNGLLTDQNPQKRYVVIYNIRGADAFAHVINRSKLPKFKLDSFDIAPKQFVADYTNCFYETDDRTEARYLSSMLNSYIVNEKVKPFQPRGKYGYRDIGRRPLMLSIPKFNSRIADHLKLATLSISCHDTIRKHSFVRKGFRGKRNEALELLSRDLQHINTIAQRLLT